MMNNKLEELKDIIRTGSKEKTLERLLLLREEVVTDEELSSSITMPSEITEMHKLLTEHIGVVQRTMQLRNRVPNRKRRALLFFQSMINGVNLTK